MAAWRTTDEKIRLLQQAGFDRMEFAQTLTSHPLYSDRQREHPVPGYDKGDYVAITAYKKS